MPTRWTHALIDAAGLAAGLLLGWALTRLFGLPLFGPGSSALAMAGIGLCGGFGMALARRWRGATPSGKSPRET